MTGWVHRFGALFIASAVVWVIFAGIVDWQVASGVVPQQNLIQWSALSWKIAVASFGATLVSLAMQWSARIDPDQIAGRWRHPRDEP